MRTGKLVLSPLVNNSCRLSTTGEYDLLTTIDQHSQIEDVGNLLLYANVQWVHNRR